MYKVLLVDDERIFLNFMSKIVDWQTEDCEIVGKAGDGEEAIKLIYETNPDIVFLDINMSGMNGLEVCKALKDNGINTKIIITTAHNEFAFAQQAIKLEVFDYLLKPFDKSEVLEALHRCIDEIKKENISTSKDFYQEQIDEFKVVIEYGIDEKKFANINEKEKKILNNSGFLPVILKTRNNEIVSPVEMNKLFAKYIKIYGVNSYYLGFYEYGLVVIHQIKNKSLGIASIARYYENLMNDAGSVSVQNVCLGEIANGIYDLHESYKKAKIAFENSVKFEHQIVSYTMLKDNIEQNRIYTVNDVNELIKSFEQKDYRATDKIIERIFGLQETQMISFKYIMAVYHSIVVRIYAYYNFAEDKTENISVHIGITDNLMQDIKDCSNSKQILMVINNYIYEVFSDCVKVQIANKKDALVAKIEEYLTENFQNSELSVTQIAEDMFFENSYIRRVYKLQRGKTIMNKLEEIRIEKAKELLNDTNYKNSEIAQMSGFSDQYYFSKRFKLITGYTPSEYKINSL